MDINLIVGFIGGILGWLVLYLLHKSSLCIKHDYRLIAIAPILECVMIRCKKCGKTKCIYTNQHCTNHGVLWLYRENLNSENWNKIKNLFKDEHEEKISTDL